MDSGLNAPSEAAFDVFPYSTISELLNAYILHKKRISPYFSISSWARRLGLPTSGIIVNFLKKRRLPPEDLAPKLAASMELSPEASEYFSALVAFERARQSKSPSETVLRNRLESLRLRSRTLTLNTSESNVLSQLPLMTVKEMLNLEDASPDLAWIHDRLSVKTTPGQIQGALSTLIQCGVVRADAQGKLHLVHAHIQSSDGVSSETIRDFHRESLENAARCLERTPLGLRHFDSYILAVDPARLPEAKKQIDDFIHDFASRFESNVGEGKEVYQLNLQYVPLTRKRETES